MNRFINKRLVGLLRRSGVCGKTTVFSMILGLLVLAGSLPAQANIVADWDAIAAATITPSAAVVLPPAVTEAETAPHLSG